MTAATATATTTAVHLEPGRAAELPGSVHGTPKLLLRLEGLAMFAAALAGFHALGGGWGLFAALFLVPDLSLLGYLAGTKVGAVVYNAGHSLMGPLLLAALGLLWGAPMTWLLTLIWVAHIGFDRMAGYGLKYSTGFGATHLGRVGRGARAA
ncbi:MAG: DUF4260 domain-containing protein [Archangium sp.]|nr:DUF4260 domain-containing protein [Archangium sp.]MDP3155130.1 DUF4260 domain-containing protein [Archangium sp.]MDP3573359.1 DUF4260 domain-containing protein [Archangium sp.]